MTEQAPRYAPERVFPAYTYVPNQGLPHPLRDEAGHSFGRAEELAPDADDSARRSVWLWGVDLFNHQYYWEAHEAWEGVWISLGKRGPEADFIKAMIKLAAAGVKAKEGKAIGVTRHATRSAELFAGAQPMGNRLQQRYGILPAKLAVTAKKLTENAEGIIDSASLPTQIVLEFA